jgi:hypothetical protein
MKVLEYNEEEKIKKLRRALDAHYKNIDKLLAIENQHLIEIEQDIANRLSRLAKNRNFTKMLKKYPELSKIYDDIHRLYAEYMEKKEPYKIEKDLCEQIVALEKKKNFQTLTEKYPDINYIQKQLKLIYQHYEEKQRLYDEINAEKAEDKKMEEEEKSSTKEKKK